MKKRVFTSLFLILGLIATLYLRDVCEYIADLVITAIGVVCCIEVSKGFNNAKKFTNVIITSIYPILLYIGFLFGILKGVKLYYYLIFYIGVALLCIGFNVAVSYIYKEETMEEQKNSLTPNMKFNRYVWDKTLNSMLILIYPALFVLPFYYLNHISAFALYVDTSISVEMLDTFSWFLIANLFVITMFTDTGAYLIGSALKGKKLCPKISPNKTISGAIGGLVFGIFGAFATTYLFFMIKGFESFFASIGGSLLVIFIIGVVGSILTQLGDIFESFLKRKCNLKDFGKILPGHGGAMDRVDGLVFNAMFMAILAIILL